MPHWRLFYHLVWATRAREPLLDDEAAALVQRSLRATSHECRAIVHAIGIMPDHVHVAVSIPPSVSIADVVKRLKGSSSHLLNHEREPRTDSTFAWQAEYAVFSFGEKALADVVAYVENQSARHASDRLWPDLEQTAPLPPARRDDKGEPSSLRPEPLRRQS